MRRKRQYVINFVIDVGMHWVDFNRNASFAIPYSTVVSSKQVTQLCQNRMKNW